MNEVDRDNFIRMQQDITYLKSGQEELKGELKSFHQTTIESQDEIKEILRKFIEEDAPLRFAPMLSWDLQKYVYGALGGTLILYAVKVILSHNFTF